jgi:hypothetical protein
VYHDGPDPVGPSLVGERLHETGQPELGGAVGRGVRPPFFPATEETLTRVPPPASRIYGKAALDSKKGALRFTASVRSQPSASNSSTGSVRTGGVNQHVQAAEHFYGPFHRSSRLGSARQVRLPRQRPAAGAGDPFFRLPQVLLAPRDQCDARPGFGQGDGDRPSPLLAPVTSAACPPSPPAALLLSLNGHSFGSSPSTPR